MPGDYLDTTDQGTLDFATKFIAGVDDKPDAVGLTTAIMASYQAARDRYAAKLSAATAMLSRGPFSIAEKDDAKAFLLVESRKIAMQAQNFSGMTDPMRVALGLTVRSRGGRSVPPPAVSPVLTAESRPGGQVVVTMKNPEQGNRARPRGCTGCTLLSYVGPDLPQDPAAFQFQGSTSRRTTTLEFGANVAAGSCVWVTGYYYNAKGQSGRAAAPVCVTLEAGVRTAGGAGAERQEKQAYPKAA